MQIIRNIILIFIIGIALHACQPEGVDGEVSYTFTDIVTFEGNDASGSHALLSAWEPGAEWPVTLTADRPLTSEQLDKGMRLLVRYTTPSNEPYTPGDATLLSASIITQSAVQTEWKEEYNLWEDYPVYLYSVWRTGNYLNFHLRLPYSTDPRIFALAVSPDDESTLTLVHVMDQEVNSFVRTYYASFDLTPILETAGDEITVRVANSNLKQTSFRIGM